MVNSLTSKASRLLTVCNRCCTELPARHAIVNKRMRRREERREEIMQFKSMESAPAERVYVWGFAATGALGVRTYLRPEAKGRNPVVTKFQPARLRFMDEQNFEIQDVACGYGFTIYSVKRGSQRLVLGCGINTDSQLGFHEYPKNTGRVLDYIIEPVPITLPQSSSETQERDTVKVACGRAHSLFLTKHGVFAQGNNAYGQCGHPSLEGESYRHVSNIRRVEGLPDNISKVVCGQDHSLFLSEDGRVYACGLGADGQTGLETYENVGIASKVKGDIDGVNIVDLASRADCVLALSDSGQVFGWGNSEYNQLSMVTKETQVNVAKHLNLDCGRVTSVASGGSICALLNDEGQVYVWGYGILGKGPNATMLKCPSVLPQPLFGCNELQPEVKVIQIKCGLNNFAAITDKGDLYTWGKGKYGNLGLHRTSLQYFPMKVALPAVARRVECGVDHTIALARSFA